MNAIYVDLEHDYGKHDELWSTPAVLDIDIENSATIRNKLTNHSRISTLQSIVKFCIKVFGNACDFYRSRT